MRRYGSGAPGLRQRRRTDQHEALHTIGVSQRISNRPDTAGGVTEQDDGVQLERVEHPVHPVDYGFEVALSRQIDRLAQSLPRPVGDDRADSLEAREQRQKERRVDACAVQKHQRRPGRLLQEMDATTADVNVTALDGRSGQDSFIDILNLDGTGVRPVRMLPLGHRTDRWVRRCHVSSLAGRFLAGRARRDRGNRPWRCEASRWP